jgi:hypothetical protein
MLLLPLRRPAFVLGKQERGKPVRLAHANASMAQRTHVLVEKLRLDRVMHVNRVLVRKIEFQLAQHVLRSRRLGEGVLQDVCVSPIDRARVDGLPLVAHRKLVLAKDRGVRLAE